MSQAICTLSNGTVIPQLGLGVFLVPDGPVAYNAVLAALKAGYRKIDTAHAYQNERSVGKAIQDSGIKREEIWVTSKLWISDYGEGKTAVAIDKMLERLGLEYIDLIYLHQPFGDIYGAWKDLEAAYNAKKVRALGISNFDLNNKLIPEFVSKVKITPHILQMECHPYAMRKEYQELAKKYKMAVECWYPFGGKASGASIMNNEVVKKIAAKHNKKCTHVILRYLIQEGLCAIPGSTNPEHIADNFNIFDFKLDEEDMNEMRKLNKEQRFYTIPEAEAREQYSKIILPD